VRRFEDYARSLEVAKVVLDAERRQALIATEARDLAFAQGLELVEDAGLTYEGAKAFATPRRLALTVHGVTARSPDMREERKGPRVGAPEKAIEGFLRGAGLGSIGEAQIQSDPKKGDFYVAAITKPGRAAEEIVAELMPRVIREFPWPKSMRWGARSAAPDTQYSTAEAEGTASLRWVRPLRSILCTFGPETEEPLVVPFDVAGIAAGNLTFGHRFMADGKPIRVRRFDDYVPALEAAKVVLDAERRMAIIDTEARNLAFAQGLEVVEDPGLLEEVAGLVEWPVVLIGSFDVAFLDIPDEVIRLTIRQNQKCFVLRDPKSGRLTSRFLLTSNIEARDGGQEIVAGNERVIAARLSDARFFFEQDRKTKLEDWGKKLGSVTFHEKLGSQAERVERIARLARELAPLVGADPDDAERAARLAKADLTTAMVGEFPELQGVMGRYYFLAENGLSTRPGTALSDLSSRFGEAETGTHEHGAHPEGSSVPGSRTGADAPSGMTTGKGGALSAPHPEVRPRTRSGGASKDEGQRENDEARLRAIADAIRDHYKPQGPNDSAPTEPVAIAVALADKLDTLVGFWAIDEKPTGSKDPFALRRAALGVIRILTDNELRLQLASLLLAPLRVAVLHMNISEQRQLRQAKAADNVQNANRLMALAAEAKELEARFRLRAGYQLEEKQTATDLLAFFADRLKVHLRETGARHDLIDAVFALPGQDDLLMIVRRVEALGKFLDSDDGANLLVGYRRAANILRAEEKKDGAGTFDAPPDASLITQAEEKMLHEAMQLAEAEASAAVAREDFATAMTALAKLRPAVDAFFDHVTVNADDPKLRANRLKLLNQLRRATLAVADFSRIGG